MTACAVVAMAGFLAACSGGGGSSSASTAPTPDQHGSAASPTSSAATTNGEHAHGSDHPYPSGTPTAAGREAADALVRDTLEAVAPFEEVETAKARGYLQAMPYAFGEVGAAHYLSPTALTDGRTLDPENPEGLIYLKTSAGEHVFLGVMYVAMDGPAPEIGGPMTPWHTHRELCLSRAALVPVLASGECHGRGFPVVQEMIHVWWVPNPNGPFAHELPAEAAAEATGLTVEELGPLPVVDEPRMRTALANALALDAAQIRDRYEAGESLDEMATAQGVDPATVRAAVADVYRADLADGVTRDHLTDPLAAQIGRFLDAQVDLLMTGHIGAEATEPETVDFGYPCVDIGCLVQ